MVFKDEVECFFLFGLVLDVEDGRDVGMSDLVKVVEEVEEAIDFERVIDDLDFMVPDKESFLEVSHGEPDDSVDAILLLGLGVAVDVL